MNYPLEHTLQTTSPEYELVKPLSPVLDLLLEVGYRHGKSLAIDIGHLALTPDYEEHHSRLQIIGGVIYTDPEVANIALSFEGHSPKGDNKHRWTLKTGVNGSNPIDEDTLIIAGKYIKQITDHPSLLPSATDSLLSYGPKRDHRVQLMNLGRLTGKGRVVTPRSPSD